MLTKEAVRALHADLNTAAAALATKHGVVITVKQIRYGTQNAVATLDIAAVDAEGVVYSREREAWADLAVDYGLDPALLDKEVVLNKYRYRVVGLNPRARKRPVLIEREGRTYTASVDQVRHATALR
jgi:hypothetical protein